MDSLIFVFSIHVNGVAPKRWMILTFKFLAEEVMSRITRAIGCRRAISHNLQLLILQLETQIFLKRYVFASSLQI